MAIDPKQNDTALAELEGKISRVMNHIESAIRTIEFYGKGATWKVADETKRLETLRVELRGLKTEAMPLHEAFAAHRWSRFFLVLNGNGHVHSSMACSTCFPTTAFGWLPELSGDAESVAVAEFGEKMCTVCFPSAPTNPAFRAPGRRDAAAKAAKAAEKAERAAAKVAKQAKAALASLVRQAVEGRVTAREIEVGAYPNPNTFVRSLVDVGKIAEAKLWTDHGIDPVEISKKAAAKWNRDGLRARYGSWPR